MNCKRCNAPLLIGGKCSSCGLKDSYVVKCMNISNRYYNLGLDKAMVRDLSGAIIDLKRALHFNKYNTQARNLLGLCYHEMGEIVKALSEWVMSNYLQPENNDATDYINSIQNNLARFEEVNTTIKKYNQSLLYLKQGDYDLALIQLKKVIGMSPNYVNGHLLLALLYMKTDSFEKAKKELRRVLKIDANNTLALKYYGELTGGSYKRSIDDGRKIKSSSDNSVLADDSDGKTNHRDIMPGHGQISIDQYVETSNNKYIFTGIIIGLLVGIAAMYFLFIPQKTDQLADSYDTLKQEYNEELSSKNKDITSLQEDKDSLNEEITDLKDQLSKATGESSSGNIFENIINAAYAYMDGDMDSSAEYLEKVDISKVDSKDAKKLYDRLSSEVLSKVSEEYYNEGYKNMTSGVYEDAITNLTKAFEYDDTNVDALYYLGRSYQFSGDNAKAKEQYEKVISDFADSRRASQAEEHLAEVSEE